MGTMTMSSRYDGPESAEGVGSLLEQVNLGQVPGHTMVATIGVSDHVGTSYTDITGMSTDLVYPTANETWLLTSTSTNDTSAGTGATEVTIIYLDDEYEIKTATVDTNGTSDVVVAADCFRALAMFCTDYGTVRGANVGDITLRNQSGGAERELLEADSRDSHSIYHTVPLGFTDFWLASTILPPKNEDVDIRVLYTIGDTGVFRGGASTVSYQSPIIYPFSTWLPLPEKSDFIQQARASNPNSKVTVISEFLRVDNTYLTSSGFGIQQMP